MELELSRVDYAIVGLTSCNCLKLFPANVPKEPQKIAVGDEDGILQILSIRKEEVQLHFKTLPGPKITSLQLGGNSGNTNDKIFIALENEVKGYTKKGKLIMTFDSGMTEPINSMYVLGVDLFICGNHVYNHYKDCKEVGSYLCGDKITDVAAFYTHKAHRLVSLIACEGRMIRALEHARVTLSMEVAAAPTVLHIFEEQNQKTILFGTIDGRVGIIDVENQHGFTRWLIAGNSSDISCMESFDLTGNSVKNLILGRQDGTIQVYSINMQDCLDEAVAIFTLNCYESVTAVQCGVVRNHGYEEILVATYTGRIFGLTTEPLDKNVGGDSTIGNYIFSQDTSAKISRLKNEIEEMQTKVLKEREKYLGSTQSFFEELSAIPLLPVKDTLTFSMDTGTYTLTIEVPVAIENVLLHSNVSIELLDVDKNSAVISHSAPDQAEGNFLLATYRCQVDTNRLEIKIRTKEGQNGVLQVYVTPLSMPKCTRLKQYEIKPLSLHYRVYDFDDSLTFNKLDIKGAFSLAEMHNWVGQCLPEVPEKQQNTIDFRSGFIGSVLRCVYQKGEASFLSDNLSTISTLKSFITKEATKKKIQLTLGVNVEDQNIASMVKLIEPKLIERKIMNDKIALLDALNELEVTEEESVKYLSQKYKELLMNEKEIRRDFATQPSYLDKLQGIIMDLYEDYYSFKGINVQPNLSMLQDIMENYSFTNIMDLFIPPNRNTEDQSND